MKKLYITAIFSAIALSGVAAVPAPPTNLEAGKNTFDVGEYDVETDIELSWTLPTTYADGTPFEAGVSVEAVKVICNNQEVVVLDGAVTEYSENEVEFGYGYSAFQVLAQVGGEWSEPSLPALSWRGEGLACNMIPWEPKMTGYKPGDTVVPWFTSYYNTCQKLAAGLTLESAGWIASHYALLLKPMGKYVLEYEVSSKAGAEYWIALIEDTYTNCEAYELDIEQMLVSPTKAMATAERKRVEFTYAPKHADGSPYWNACPYFAIVCDNEAVLSYLSITDYNSASVSLPEADAAADCAVYNLQGVYLGRSADDSLEGYAPGIYILRTADGHARKVLVK